MLIDLIYIVLGLVFLVISADKFILGASNTALYLGMSPLVVGMVIVGFGTSAPEMIVSAIAAQDNSPGIAIGNAYGSNIVNIALVLGIATVLYPITVNSKIVRREIPLLIAAIVVSYAFMSDNFLSRLESTILIILLVGVTIFSVFYQEKGDSLESETDSEYTKDMSLPKSLIYLFAGLTVLLISSKVLVMGAVNIANYFGVSDLIIGLTIVAIGTSLPELAATVIAAKKGESDIALGNIVGSGLFNVLGVVGIAGVIRPLPIDNTFLHRDFATVFALVLLLWGFAFGFKKAAKIGKIKGLILLLTFFIYSVYLFATIN